MRIISGKFKSRKLISFDEDHIRPMTDRVKESLFNILSSEIEGSNFLDLYAGTGNVGLEALSRGAQTVTLVEKSPKSLKVIEKNLSSLGVTREEVQVVRGDVLDFLRKCGAPPFDIIVIDPPFPAQICLKTLEVLSESQALGPNTKVIIEHSTREPLPAAVSRLKEYDKRSYGDKILSFFAVNLEE